AEAEHHPTERLRARVEVRPSRVILEAGDRSPAAAELRLEQHVADHPPIPCDGLEWQQADARHVLAAEAAIAAPQQLIAAADREEGGTSLDNSLLQRAGLRGEVLGDEQLLAVLAAAD